jgi:hypothetical protein
MQNGFCESFNGRMRDEPLNESLLFGLDHARTRISASADDYNDANTHLSMYLKRRDSADRDTIPWGILDSCVRVRLSRVLAMRRERRGLRSKDRLAEDESPQSRQPPLPA